MQQIYAGALPEEFRKTNHGVTFWQEYQQTLLQLQVQKDSVKQEAMNPVVLELVRLAGVALTPPIDADHPVEPVALEAEAQVSS